LRHFIRLWSAAVYWRSTGESDDEAWAWLLTVNVAQSKKIGPDCVTCAAWSPEWNQAREHSRINNHAAFHAPDPSALPGWWL
jgi:hypothetical protein